MDKYQVIESLYNLSNHKSSFGSVFVAEYNNWHNALLEELPAEINFFLQNQQNPQKLINFNDLIKVIKDQMAYYEMKVAYDENLRSSIESLNGSLWEFIKGLEKVWLNDCNDCASLDLFLKKISDFKEESSTQIILANSTNFSSVVAKGDTMSLNVVDSLINSQSVSASSNGSNIRINTNINSNSNSNSYNSYNGLNGRVNPNVDNLFSSNQHSIWVRADHLNLPKHLAKADYYYVPLNEWQDISSNPKANAYIVENKSSLEAKSGLASGEYVILSNFINNVVDTDGLTNDTFKTVHERYYNNSDKLGGYKLGGYKLGGLNTSKNLKNCNQLISIDFHGNLWKDTPKYIEHILNTKIMNTFDWFANYYGIDVSIYDFLNLKGQGTINENSSILINKLNSNGIINLNDSRFIGGDNVIELDTSKNPLFMKSWYIKSPLFYGFNKNNIDIN